MENSHIFFRRLESNWIWYKKSVPLVLIPVSTTVVCERGVAFVRYFPCPFLLSPDGKTPSFWAFEIGVMTAGVVA